jgi:hypothetical protein
MVLSQLLPGGKMEDHSQDIQSSVGIRNGYFLNVSQTHRSCADLLSYDGKIILTSFYQKPSL